MTPAERQRARDRAADAIAPRDMVIIDPRHGWPPRLVQEPGLCHAERQRRYRARTRASS